MRRDDEPRMITVRLAGTLSQGAPIRYTAAAEEIRVPADHLEPHEYVLRAAGSGLHSFGVEHGDLLIVEPRPNGTATTGELVLAQIGECVFLGRWWTKHGRRVLMGSSIRPLSEATDLRVIGAITVLMRLDTSSPL
jgi:SOS-response transcriptional repressor LexA